MIKNPRYERCYVAFLDILGFKEKVIESQDSADVLTVLLSVMNLCGSIPSGAKVVSRSLMDGERTISVQSRFFSDSLCFFIRDNENDLPHLLLIIRYLQDQLWKKGICLRGGIDVGDMYWPDGKGNITIGPGLLSAYKLESEVAIFPRIVVSPELCNIMKNVDADPFGSSGVDLANYLCYEEDINYLNLLHGGLSRFEGERLEGDKDYFYLTWNSHNPTMWYSVINDVQRTIDENVSRSTDKRVIKKYKWLQSYLTYETS